MCLCIFCCIYACKHHRLRKTLDFKTQLYQRTLKSYEIFAIAIKKIQLTIISCGDTLALSRANFHSHLVDWSATSMQVHKEKKRKKNIMAGREGSIDQLWSSIF
jgi:hypothetical protein